MNQFFFLQELEALRREMEKKEQEILELEALLQQDTKGPSAGMPCTSLVHVIHSGLYVLVAHCELCNYQCHCESNNCIHDLLC